MKVFALLSILEEHKNLTLEEKKLAEKKGSLIKAFWKLFKGYWCSEEKWKARGLFIIVILMNIAVVYIQVKLVYWNNDFFNIIGKRCFESFGPSVKEFLILIATFTLIATYLAYLERFLYIKWRTWLTNQFIDNWMKDQAYYRIQVSGKHTDNQDQRICEDIDEFTDITIKFLSGITRMIASLIAFTAVLWEFSGMLTLSLGENSIDIPGYMIWCCLIYTAVGSFLAHIIGRKLISLNFDQQRYEADLRFSMMRVRENAESIAFYRGEEIEKKNFKERFKNVVSNYWKLESVGKL